MRDSSAVPTQQYGDLFGFSRGLIRKNRGLASRWRPKTNEAGVVLYHFSKAVNLLDATYRMCRSGFAREALPVSRSLFNLLINLKWLTKPRASSSRIERFTDHEMTSKANNAMTLIKWDKKITAEQKTAHRALIRRTRPIAKSLGIKAGKDGRYPKWHPSIEDMARDVDMLSDYHITYGRLSQTEHTDPESVTEYLEDDADEQRMRGVIGPRSKFVPLVTIEALRYFLNVKRSAAAYLGFAEDQEELNEFGRLLRKYGPSLGDC